MTQASNVSSHTVSEAHGDGAGLPLVPALIVLAMIAVWVGATAVWGWNGFIGCADVVVLLVFGVILRATRV